MQVVPAKRLIKSVSTKVTSSGSLLSQERMRIVSRGISLRALGNEPEAAIVRSAFRVFPQHIHASLIMAAYT